MAEEVNRYLEDMEYPTNKGDIIRHAEEEGADQDIIRRLAGLPDRNFSSADEVNSELATA